MIAMSTFTKVVQYLNVDKIMMQFKGLHPMPKISPKKTIKSGYKLWMIVDTDGHINKFDVHHREIDYKNFSFSFIHS